MVTRANPNDRWKEAAERAGFARMEDGTAEDLPMMNDTIRHGHARLVDDPLDLLKATDAEFRRHLANDVLALRRPSRSG